MNKPIENKKVNIRCIVCPSGCNMEVFIDVFNHLINITGNKCLKGYKFAEDEISNPLRLLTTTISINSVKLSRIPVRSDKYIPKKLLKKLIEEVKTIKVILPVEAGEIIAENLLNTGINIISTISILH